MKNHVTIKDVAQEAGVSVATVSYVVNHRMDKRISDATRKKVLQIINLLGYIPNQSAQALATSRSRMIALYVSPDVPILKNAEQHYFINFFSSFLHEKNFGLIYLSEAFTEKYDHADAIVGYDISSDYFRQIGDCNFVPLLAFDCFIHDNRLFFQINSDYQKMMQAADAQFQGQPYTLLTLDTPNREKKEHLNSIFPSVSFVSGFEELFAYTGQNLLLIDHTLYTLMKPQMESSDSICYQPVITTEKAEALLQYMECALERKPVADDQHNVLV